MRNKLYLLVIIVILFICSTGCTTDSSRMQIRTPIYVELNNGDKVEYLYKIDAKNLDLEESSNRLLIIYMDSLKSEETSTNEMIEDYTINDLKVTKESENSYQVFANISVKPAYRDSDWVSGDCTFDKFGWINNKHIEMNIIIQGDIHSLESIVN